MIEVNCYHCKSHDYKFYANENGYTLVKCKNCGLLYVNPRPSDDEITTAIQTGIHRGEEKLNVTNSFNEKAIPRYLSILNSFYKEAELIDKSWLDIGCGNGEFLIALNKFSDSKIQIKGTEPNVLKVEEAKRHNLDVEYLDLNQHKTQFDFISLLNVFSHLINPPVTIKNWRRLLKEDGELLIETGHSSHLPSKFHSKPYLLPDHLSFGNKDILVQLLKNCGFQILNVKVYRGVTYPDLTLYNAGKEMIKLLIGRRNSFHTFFPVYQHGDMFIRAKKI